MIGLLEHLKNMFIAWAVNSSLPWVGIGERVHLFLIVTPLIDWLWKRGEVGVRK